jgi:hypothetical protein
MFADYGLMGASASIPSICLSWVESKGSVKLRFVPNEQPYEATSPRC